MFEKLVSWLKKHFEFTSTDFPDHDKCDPNEPCRHIEPRDMTGGRFKFEI